MAKLQSGTVVYGNLTVNTFANINGNLILGAQIYAAGSPGVNGQVLQNVGGTGVAWANPSSGSSIFNGTSNVTVLSSGSNVVVSVAGAIIANIGSSGMTIIGGLSAGSITGNGAALTGLPAGYSNVNAATYLPIYSGTVGASFVNSTGNVLAQAGVFNALGINGAITGTGYINTTANISTAQLNAGQINTTGNILSTGAVHNALTVNGATTVTGNISAPTMNVTHTTIGSTYGNQSIIGVWSGSDGSNNEFLELTNTRTAAGSTWTTAGYRLQQKIDATWMGYVQFNGASTNGGIAFGTGTNTTNAVSVTDSVRIDTNGVTIVGLKNQTVAISNGGTSGVGNIGAAGAVFNTIFGKATTAQYADLAEIYTSDFDYEPGTVVIFGGTAEVTVSTLSHDTRIAGVVSTNPAYLMNSTETGVEVALMGRVPCSVLGPVAKGDRLVASQTAGVAQRLNTNLYQPGCIIGKALEAIDSATISTIEVVVGRL